MNKIVTIGSEARIKMKEGVDLLANAVKVTLGPRGRHVAIERKGRSPLITKDGVTVARSITLKDNISNMGAELIKSVASEANLLAGDGTTTATVLSQEIFNSALKYISSGNNPVLIKRGIDLATDIVIKELRDMAVSISDEKSLYNVARISANNDGELGLLIAEVISKIGDDGFISVEESTTNKT